MADLSATTNDLIQRIINKVLGSVAPIPPPTDFDLHATTNDLLYQLLVIISGGGGGGLTGSGTPPEMAFWNTSATDLGSATGFEFHPGELLFGTASDTIFDFTTIDGNFSIGMQNSFLCLGIKHTNSDANILIGDTGSLVDGDLYELNAGAHSHKFQARHNEIALFDNGSLFPIIRLGDIPAASNNTNFFIDDLASEFNMQSLGSVMMQLLNAGGVICRLGDISGFGAGTEFEIDDTALRITASATGGFRVFGPFVGSAGIKTADPGGGAGDWNLGQVIAGAVTPDAANYVETKINGATVKLIKAV